MKKRKQRAGISRFWEEISTFNNNESNFNISRFKELKKPEVEYVVNAFKGVVSTMVKLQRGDFDKKYLSQIIIEADEKELNKKGFSILDSAKLKAVDYLQDMRIQYEKNGIYVDGFDEYKNDLQNNLLETLKAIDDKGYKNRFFEECVKRGTLVYGSFN
jgi:predicted transglutaminase-like protease